MPAGKQGGFAYVALLITLAIVAAGVGAVADVWHTTMRREREKELLFVGHQFRQALAQFAQRRGRYPTALAEMLGDGTANSARFLRKIYPDPLTGTEEWGTVSNTGGQIVGVYSRFDGEPLKQKGFAERDNAVEGKKKYAEWIFSPLASVASPNDFKAAPPPNAPQPRTVVNPESGLPGSRNMQGSTPLIITPVVPRRGTP